MSNDTARRKLAEEWLNGDNQITVEESDWARGLAGNFDDDYGVLIGYLAGSREEAAIKDAEIEIIRKTYEQEIAALKQNDANREALLDSLLRLRNEHILEIAALREAALDLIDEINKHPISSTISSTSIHYFKRTLSDRCPARPKEKP